MRVHFQVVEGTRRRTQVFEGVVLKRKGGGARRTFTVRKLSFGVGVERTFPVHSPKIERIEVVGRGEVRRAKLYYLRGRVGRAARLREMRDFRPEDVGMLMAPEEPKAAVEDGEAAPEEAVEAEAAEAAPEGEAPVEEAAAEEASAEEPPAVEATAEQAPAEEAAAEEPPASDAEPASDGKPAAEPQSEADEQQPS